MLEASNEMASTLHTYDVHYPSKEIKYQGMTDRANAVSIAESIDGYVIHREWVVHTMRTIADFR